MASPGPIGAAQWQGVPCTQSGVGQASWLDMLVGVLLQQA